MSDLDEIRQLEEELEAKKKAVADRLYQQRHAANLSLSQVARSVRVSAPTVQQAEKGLAWSSRTIAKLSRFYERRGQKANGQEATTAP